MLHIREINDKISIATLDLASFSKDQGIEIKRELEKAGTRALLRKLLNGQDFDLAYTLENKPYLQGRTEHISISHSHDKLVIILNKKENTGIDIELIRDKVIKIKHKFLNQQELIFAGNDVDKLITLWSAKEALYKVYGLKQVDFSKDFFVEHFSDESLKGHIISKGFKKSYQLVAEKIESYKMVYVLNEI